MKGAQASNFAKHGVAIIEEAFAPHVEPGQLAALHTKFDDMFKDLDEYCRLLFRPGVRTTDDDAKIATLGRRIVDRTRQSLNGRAVTVKEHLVEGCGYRIPRLGAYINEQAGEHIISVKKPIIARARSIREDEKRKQTEAELLSGYQDLSADRAAKQRKLARKRNFSQTAEDREAKRKRVAAEKEAGEMASRG